MSSTEKDKYYADQRVQNKTYFGKSFESSSNTLRYAHKLLDHSMSEYILKDERTIGYNKTGLRQLKALLVQVYFNTKGWRKFLTCALCSF